MLYAGSIAPASISGLFRYVVSDAVSGSSPLHMNGIGWPDQYIVFHSITGGDVA